MKHELKRAGIVAAVVALAYGTGGMALADSGVSERGIVPDAYAGNFVASDDQQVCFELEKLGYIGEITTDMIGIKIDPPGSFDNGTVKTTLSADGKYLDWEATNATVHAFVIKGGPNYHVYDYVGTGFDWDNGLHSPLARKNVPQISHYNFCYTPEVPEGDQGCTPGYWRNHHDRWMGASPADDFDATFGVDLFVPNITLAMAVELGGGGVNALARHATAALLNAYGGVPNSDGTTVAYPYTVDEVIAMVQAAALDPALIETNKDLLATANELGCPLSGTPATK